MTAPVRFVTVEKFGDFSGYTPDAVRSKIKRGDWLEGAVWVKAPDGRILMDLEGYERWARGGMFLQHRQAAPSLACMGVRLPRLHQYHPPSS